MSEKEKQAIESLNKSTEKLTPAQMQRLSDIAYGMALSEGITTGTTENTFSPDSECTRAQAVAFLFRYAASEAVTLQELVSGFSDADSVPGYALPAMNWALAEEIVQGNGSKLMPNDSCTRAQIVTFLFRAYQGK